MQLNLNTYERSRAYAALAPILGIEGDPSTPEEARRQAKAELFIWGAGMASEWYEGQLIELASEVELHLDSALRDAKALGASVDLKSLTDAVGDCAVARRALRLAGCIQTASGWTYGGGSSERVTFPRDFWTAHIGSYAEDVASICGHED